MLRCLIVVGVALLPLAFTINVSDGECKNEGKKIKCTCTENQRNYSTVLLQGDSASNELTISGCANAELGPGFFIENLPLEKISFHDIGRLVVHGTFPADLSVLHLDRVTVESLSADIFSGDTRLKHLRVHNSTVLQIKRDTFENVAVENAHFEHVNFLALEEDALAFSLNMTEADRKNHAEIHFKRCRFPALDVYPISVAYPGRIAFEDNVLDCTDLPLTYVWLDQMIGEQKQKDLFCTYLDENYCGEKRDDRKLIWMLFGSGRLSDKLGMSLKDSCSEQYQEYLVANKRGLTSNVGWTVRASFGLLITGLAAISIRG